MDSTEYDMGFSFDLPPELERLPNRIREILEDLAREQRGQRRGGAFLAADVLCDDSNYFILVDVPGASKEDVEVNLVGERSVEISGTRREPGQVDRRMVSRERNTGSFRRTVHLPEDASIDADAVEATIRDGVLTVTLRRLGGRARRSVEVS